MKALELILAARAAAIGVSLVDGQVCLSTLTGTERTLRPWVNKLRPHFPEVAAWLVTEQAIERARAATTTPRTS